MRQQHGNRALWHSLLTASQAQLAATAEGQAPCPHTSSLKALCLARGAHFRAAACIQELAREEALRAMQLQHAKQAAKLRQEMQLTVQQMAEEQQRAMHEFREQQTELYRQRAQTIEERRATDVQACAMVSPTCIAAMLTVSMTPLSIHEDSKQWPHVRWCKHVW